MQDWHSEAFQDLDNITVYGSYHEPYNTTKVLRSYDGFNSLLSSCEYTTLPPMASDQTDQVFCNPPHNPLVLLSSASRALSRKTKVLVDDELSGARVAGGKDSEANDDGYDIVRT